MNGNFPTLQFKNFDATHNYFKPHGKIVAYLLYHLFLANITTFTQPISCVVYTFSPQSYIHSCVLDIFFKVIDNFQIYLKQLYQTNNKIPNPKKKPIIRLYLGFYYLKELYYRHKIKKRRPQLFNVSQTVIVKQIYIRFTGRSNLVRVSILTSVGPYGRPTQRAISSVVERAPDNCIVVPGL
jgi:hypothetical protein